MRGLFTLLNGLLPRPLPDEAVTTLPAVWSRIEALRKERKFVPHEYPPLGYVGPDRPQDFGPLTDVVDGAIDGVLALRSDVLSASTVRPILRRAERSVFKFATEDRDRVRGYLIEVWYILGFKVSLFGTTYGSYFTIPEGYGEPLPPGWTAPDRPRPIAA